MKIADHLVGGESLLKALHTVIFSTAHGPAVLQLFGRCTSLNEFRQLCREHYGFLR